MYEEEDKSRNVKIITSQPPSTTWLLCEKTRLCKRNNTKKKIKKCIMKKNYIMEKYKNEFFTLEKKSSEFGFSPGFTCRFSPRCSWHHRFSPQDTEYE